MYITHTQTLSHALLVRILESVAIHVAVGRISIGDYGNRRETLTFGTITGGRRATARRKSRSIDDGDRHGERSAERYDMTSFP